MQIQSIGAVRTMTSRELAALAEKRHDNVMRVCRDLRDTGVCPQIEETPYIEPANGQTYMECRLNTRHATIIAVQRATGTRHDWLPLRRWCKSHGLEAVDVPDARYGTAKAWPAGAWSAVHGVDLVELFGEVAA